MAPGPHFVGGEYLLLPLSRKDKLTEGSPTKQQFGGICPGQVLSTESEGELLQTGSLWTVGQHDHRGQPAPPASPCPSGPAEASLHPAPQVCTFGTSRKAPKAPKSHHLARLVSFPSPFLKKVANQKFLSCLFSPVRVICSQLMPQSFQGCLPSAPPHNFQELVGKEMSGQM